VESYSIKDLDAFDSFTRSIQLADAKTNLRVIERALELGKVTADVRAAVERYNCDDCLSALHLRDWFERLRASIEAGGTLVPRPQPEDGSPSPKLVDRARRVQALIAALTADLPAERAKRDDEQQGRWLRARYM